MVVVIPHGLKLSMCVYFVYGLLGGTGQGCHCLSRTTGMIYKAICIWLPLMLGWSFSNCKQWPAATPFSVFAFVSFG